MTKGAREKIESDIAMVLDEELPAVVTAMESADRDRKVTGSLVITIQFTNDPGSEKRTPADTLRVLAKPNLPRRTLEERKAKYSGGQLDLL